MLYFSMRDGCNLPYQNVSNAFHAHSNFITFVQLGSFWSYVWVYSTPFSKTGWFYRLFWLLWRLSEVVHFIDVHVDAMCVGPTRQPPNNFLPLSSSSTSVPPMSSWSSPIFRLERRGKTRCVREVFFFEKTQRTLVFHFIEKRESLLQAS
jgi:hypothetical protein